jgi:hypothetical protein
MPADSDQLVQMYVGLREQVKQADEVLDAASDKESAGRRAYINTLVKASETRIASAMQSIMGQIVNDPDEAKYGFYFGLVRALRNEFDDKGTAFADEQVKSQPKIEISADELEKATAERQQYASQMKYLFEILKMLVPENQLEELGKPPRKRSIGGPKGKRAISYYSWKVDGEDFDGTINELAKALGFERGVDLRNEMKDAGINLTRPPAEIIYETSNGKTIVGTRSADAPDWEESEVEEDEDEDEDETEAE